MTAFVALLRGINLGRRQVPMAELRALATALGLEKVRTYVASGNLLFESGQGAAALEKALEEAIAERFGFPVEVILRSAAQWRAIAAANPMPDETARAPSKVMMTIGKQTPTAADLAVLRDRASPDERVEQAGEALWFWFGEGAGRSKLPMHPPGKGVWTTRNARTVATLQEMLDDPAG
jgi:uncharacterized protein (DUF1697 family)